MFPLYATHPIIFKHNLRLYIAIYNNAISAIEIPISIASKMMITGITAAAIGPEQEPGETKLQHNRILIVMNSNYQSCTSLGMNTIPL